MSAGQQNHLPGQSNYLSLSALEGAAHGVTILVALWGAFSLVSEVYLRTNTVPVAGYSDVSVPRAGEECPVFIREWKLHNPGPGDLRDVELEIDVADEYDTATATFATGLVVTDGQGVAHTIEKTSYGARVRVFPKSRQLDCWNSCLCRFHIREETWSVNQAASVLPGMRTFDANVPYKPVSPRQTNWIWPIGLLLIAAAMYFLNSMKKKSTEAVIEQSVREQVEQAKHDIYAQAVTEYQETLAETSPTTLPPTAAQRPPAQDPPLLKGPKNGH